MVRRRANELESPPGRYANIRRRAVAVVLAASVVAMVATSFAPSAKAEVPAEQGWWTSLSPGSVGSTNLIPTKPPDVPSNGLLIQGGLQSVSGQSDTGAVAYGALSYPIPYGSTPGTLTLSVAANSATTPMATLELCKLTSDNFRPEQGGPASDAPTFNCATHVTAPPGSGGSYYRFDITSLVSNGVVAFAVLPTSPADRVVLAQPGSDSLPVQTSTTIAAGHGTTSSNGGSIAPPASNTPLSTIGNQGGTASTINSGTQAPGPDGIPSASPPSPRGASLAPLTSPTEQAIPASGRNLSRAVSSSTNTGFRPWVGLLFLLAILSAAGLWSGAARSAMRQSPQA